MPIPYPLRHLYQALLLKLPCLPDLLLGSGKILAFLRIWHFVKESRVAGDYLEFGVFKGSSFALSLRCAARFFPRGSGPRFFAFDSFEGMPAPDPARDAGAFEEGAYAAERREFERTIRGAARGRTVHVVPGRFETALSEDVRSRFQLAKACFINIDCGLFASTRAALDFVAPLLQTGTVIYFDDWNSCRGDQGSGEPGACRDWLASNPRVKLVDYGDVGIVGKAFLVNLA